MDRMSLQNSKTPHHFLPPLPFYPYLLPMYPFHAHAAAPPIQTAGTDFKGRRKPSFTIDAILGGSTLDTPALTPFGPREIPSAVSRDVRQHRFAMSYSMPPVASRLRSPPTFNAAGFARRAGNAVSEFSKKLEDSKAEIYVQGPSRKKETQTTNGWRKPKPKRVRTIFTPEQLDTLEREFARQQYMVGSERYYLAASLNLTQAQVKVWFQNRRIKWRKHNLEQQQTKLAEIRAKQLAEDGVSDDSGTENVIDSQTYRE